MYQRTLGSEQQQQCQRRDDDIRTTLVGRKNLGGHCRAALRAVPNVNIYTWPNIFNIAYLIRGSRRILHCFLGTVLKTSPAVTDFT
jgi:hypothetical protein